VFYPPSSTRDKLLCKKVMIESYPVELLRDGRGIYGIGVSGEFDIEALASTFGVDSQHIAQYAHAHNVILRPDMLQLSEWAAAAIACHHQQTYWISAAGGR
jgi:hypothetical protein